MIIRSPSQVSIEIYKTTACHDGCCATSRTVSSLYKPQIGRLYGRKNPLETRSLKPVYALKEAGEERAIIRQHRVVAVLKELRSLPARPGLTDREAGYARILLPMRWALTAVAVVSRGCARFLRSGSRIPGYRGCCQAQVRIVALHSHRARIDRTAGR